MLFCIVKRNLLEGQDLCRMLFQVKFWLKAVSPMMRVESSDRLLASSDLQLAARSFDSPAVLL